LADYGNIAKAIEAQIKEVNDAGGITDSEGKTRKITFIVKDDGYDAARTIPLVDELIDAEKVFAMWTLGSPNTMKTYDKLNQRCIPQPLSMTGHPAWGDPVNHPWTTGMQLAYNTEAVLWGAFIEQRLDELAPDGGTVTVAALVMNNDFGKAYESGFKAFLEESEFKDRIDFQFETIEPQAPTVTDPMTTLASKNPQVFIAMVAGTPCTQAITEAANNGMTESVDYLFQPSVCGAKSFVGQDKVGMAADGWWIVQGGVKDISSPAYDNDPYIKYAREQLAANGLDYKASGSFGSGYFFGWSFLESLKIASQLEGGLTRSNYIVALRSMDMTHPYALEGIKFNMNGNEDPYFVEGGAFQVRDAASETWNTEGDVIDLSGASKPCAFDQATASCN
ncbi:MAG: ABC transporter substrate-binding protein, partial [Acidimicrobiia bacterium]